MIGLFLVTVSVLPGAAGTAAAQTADVDMAYGCDFPSGPQQVKVRVTVSLPEEGVAGQAVQPGEPTITITVPQAALADVTKLEAATVGATARLAVQVTGQGAPAATAWPDLAAARTALPQDGDLTLAAAGPVPPVSLAAAGDAAFVADRLDIELAPLKADGTATSPAAIPLACTPVIGYDTTLGIVAVSDAAGPGLGAGAGAGAGGQGRPRQAAVLAADDGPRCPALPTGGLNPKFPLPAIPPGSRVDTAELTEDGHACGLVAGFSNVKKLNGAAPVGGTASIGLNLRTVTNPSLNYLSPAGVVEANLEPQRATLLTFGFMPVSATMELTQLGNMNVVTEGPFALIPPQPPLVATISGEVSLRLTDARVNGVPLDLGPDCRTARPIELILRGGDQAPRPYALQPGGTLTGEITIPPFTGCGVGEDLDPLLTASVSGPGNAVQATQGPLCQEVNPPTLAFPCPPARYGVTVEPGGRWTATTDDFAVRLPAATPDFLLACSSLEMTGTFKSGTGRDHQGIGEVTGFTGECEGAGPPLSGQQFTVTPHDLPWKLDTEFYDPVTGAMEGHFRGESLHLSSPVCSFDLSDPSATPTNGRFGFRYTNSSHTLSLVTANSQLNISNIVGCTTGFTRPIRTTDRMQFASEIVVDPPQTLTAP